MIEAVYVSRHSCGRICAAAVANKDAAKDVARWVRDGRPVETMAIEQARTETWCSCFRPEGKQSEMTGKATS